VNIGDSVKIVCQEVTILEYLPENHRIKLTPNDLSKDAIENNLVWGSEFIIPASTLGFKYKKYENNIFVVKSGIDYYQTVDYREAMYKFARIKQKIPKLELRPSFATHIPELYALSNAVKNRKIYSLSHLSGVLYSKCKKSDNVMVQSFEGLIYYINPRLLTVL